MQSRSVRNKVEAPRQRQRQRQRSRRTHVSYASVIPTDDNRNRNRSRPRTRTSTTTRTRTATATGTGTTGDNSNPTRFCPVGVGGTKDIDLRRLKLFIGCLPKDVTSADLYRFFSAYGVIRESVVIPDRFRIESRGYGFVTFKYESSARRVLASRPIYLGKAKLDIKYASVGERPRRATFSVKHGTIGHGYLKHIPMKRNNNHHLLPNSRGYSVPSPSKMTHSNFTVYRTANIQQIEAVSLESFNNINSIPKKKAHNKFPNEDIKKDFRNLLAKNRCNNPSNIQSEKVYSKGSSTKDVISYSQNANITGFCKESTPKRSNRFEGMFDKTATSTSTSTSTSVSHKRNFSINSENSSSNTNTNTNTNTNGGEQTINLYLMPGSKPQPPKSNRSINRFYRKKAVNKSRIPSSKHLHRQV